jgi:hypothetical protein
MTGLRYPVQQANQEQTNSPLVLPLASHSTHQEQAARD